nr:CAZy families GH3 protein [uncultured Clostridium sp.]
MSDWGGVNDRVQALKAGLDLEMPGTGDVTTQQIITAVKEGNLTTDQLDQAVSRILEFILNILSNIKKMHRLI